MLSDEEIEEESIDDSNDSASSQRSEALKESEGDPETEEEEEETESNGTSSWDGWKVLLDRYGDIFPDDFELPAPNTDPAYIPTPPVPSLD